jgi:hypothetical protein
VRALTRDLFRADIDAHWKSFQDFRGYDFDGFPEMLGVEE